MSLMTNNAGLQILPFYLLCDESTSMSGAPIDAVNEGLQKIWHALLKSPAAADKAWVSIITFSDTAEVLVPLTDLRQLAGMPGCKTRGGTNFGNAFRKMKEVIDTDVQNLSSQGLKVIRPVVFFMSDGEPQDSGWQHAHSELIDKNYPSHPHIMSFGIGGANGTTIDEVATTSGDSRGKVAYLAKDGSAPETVISEIIHLFIGSVLGSTLKPGGGGVNIPVPDPKDLLSKGLIPAIPQISLDVIN